MKQFRTFFLLLILLIHINCDTDRCDDGYSEVNNSDGSSYCIKDFESGIQNRINEFGNTFYHEEHGVIKFNEGKWYNDFNEPLKLEE
ncbi:hypothetical protein L3X37_15140 [Sabulilitoribacter arenilitoris]|uniref:Uncharacterized protein n=1 Tax=Wocania arenilitoris TaxID=2044858 RepID=A0AAE3ERM2_9FLAO|nr:hypothetical protein [Wocania arenilitoris]MCF7569681.1 hypothetical protein [Wocania arenilitoris]